MEGTLTTEEVDAMLAEFLADNDPESIDGRALQLIFDIPKAPGESYTDGECLEMIGQVIEKWRQLQS